MHRVSDPILTLAVASVLWMGVQSARADGPLSPYYVTRSGSITVYQDSNPTWSFNPGSGGENAIAVADTVRTMGQDSRFAGAEYTLAGAFTGATYAFSPASGLFLDGTTDGLYNYSLDYRTATVYRFDRNWANPQSLFSIPGGTLHDYIGITYDPTNNSFWVSGHVLSTVANYDMQGGLLSSFGTGHSYNAGLAFDQADGTLWLVNGTASPLMEQYSTTGNLLDTAPMLNTSTVYGGEIVPIPAPGAGLLAVMGLGLIGWARRRLA